MFKGFQGNNNQVGAFGMKTVDKLMTLRETESLTIKNSDLLTSKGQSSITSSFR